jgi:hypothetical protein
LGFGFGFAFGFGYGFGVVVKGTNRVVTGRYYIVESARTKLIHQVNLWFVIYKIHADTQEPYHKRVLNLNENGRG